MFSRKYFTFFIASILLLIGSVAVFAQTAPVTGKVELKKADGTTAPVADAVIEVYRVDIKTKLPSGKSNKKGEFSFAGFPLGSTLVFAVSGAGINPEIIPNVRPGSENILINVTEGNGKKLTEEEVRGALAGAAANPAGGGQPSADQKKAAEELAKQRAEIESKNKKIEESNAVIQASLKEGNDAFNAKNYDVAIAKFEQGYQASPDYVGSAPVLLNNKGAALRSRAVIIYNENVKNPDVTAKVAAMTKVRQDLADAVEAYNKSFMVLKNAPATDVSDPKALEATKLQALSGAKEAMRLMGQTEQVDMSKNDTAKAILTEYMLIEPDKAKKAEAQRFMGDIYRVVGDSENAIAEYKKVLEIDPADPDALAGLGLSLVNLGFINNDKTKFQEGSNILQKYIDSAPAGHKYVDDAKGLIATLKKEQSVAPQKSAGKKKN